MRRIQVTCNFFLEKGWESIWKRTTWHLNQYSPTSRRVLSKEIEWELTWPQSYILRMICANFASFFIIISIANCSLSLSLWTFFTVFLFSSVLLNTSQERIRGTRLRVNTTMADNLFEDLPPPSTSQSQPQQNTHSSINTSTGSTQGSVPIPPPPAPAHKSALKRPKPPPESQPQGISYHSLAKFNFIDFYLSSLLDLVIVWILVFCRYTCVV